MDVNELLRAGYSGKLTSLRPLQVIAGLSADQVADALFLSRTSVYRLYKNPASNLGAMRLLSIIAGYVPWDGWRGWEVHSGYLFAPGYTRGGLLPGDIMALPFTYQLLDEYKRQLGAGVSREASPLLVPENVAHLGKGRV